MRLRERHLLAGGQQVDPADRAQVEPQRVEARLDRQVDLRLLAARAALPSAPARHGRRPPAGRSLVGDDVDRRLEQVRAELHDLLLGDLDLLEARRDLLERQIAPLAALGHQRPQLLDVEDARLGGSSSSATASSLSLNPSLLRLHGRRLRGPSDCQVVRVRGIGREGLSHVGQDQGVSRGQYTTDCAICLARASVSWTAAMSERIALLGSDVQARRPSTHVSLSRVGVTGVEKVIRIRVNGEAEQLFYAELECFVDLGPEQKGAHMSRFEEVVNEAIDEVDPRRGLQGRDARGPHRRARARPPGRPARRGHDRGALPRAQARRRRRASRTQEIYTLFGSAVASARGTRRLVGVEAQGMTACPCAQELVMERSQRAARRAGLQRGRDRARVRVGAGGHAQPARHRHAARRLPRGLRRRDRGGDAARDRRGVDELRDLRADEALGRGRGRREGAHAPALRRGLRARDGAHGESSASRRSARTASSRRARRTSRRSTSTTSWPSATACSASCAARSPTGDALAGTTCRCASGSRRATSGVTSARLAGWRAV